MLDRTSGDVGRYYDQEVKVAAASGAGLIWFMGKDHLSPPMLNIDAYAMDAERWREATSERVLYLTRRMGVGYGDKVLDIGTGIGGPGRDVITDSGCKLYGLNISDKQIWNLRTTSDQANIRYASITRGDMQAMPYPNDFFESAFSINAIYHVSDPSAVIRETARILKKGGRFGVDDWFITGTTTEASHDKLRKNWSTSAGGFHNFDAFVQTMQDEGLAIVDIVDFTREAGEFLTEERFGQTYDTQIAPKLLEAFPQLYQYDGYQPWHAIQAVAQLRADILYMGELYRNGQAVYRQVIGEKL